MSYEYVRRWPISDQELTTEELRAEAIPDLLEALQSAGLKLAPQTVRYSVVDGAIPFFEASLTVKPTAGVIFDDLAELDCYENFETWHAEQYFRHMRQDA